MKMKVPNVIQLGEPEAIWNRGSATGVMAAKAHTTQLATSLLEKVSHWTTLPPRLITCLGIGRAIRWRDERGNAYLKSSKQRNSESMHMTRGTISSINPFLIWIKSTGSNQIN